MQKYAAAVWKIFVLDFTMVDPKSLEFRMAYMTTGGLMSFLHFVGGTRVPNGIISGWDQGAAGIGTKATRIYLS